MAVKIQAAGRILHVLGTLLERYLPWWKFQRPLCNMSLLRGTLMPGDRYKIDSRRYDESIDGWPSSKVSHGSTINSNGARNIFSHQGCRRRYYPKMQMSRTFWRPGQLLHILSSLLLEVQRTTKALTPLSREVACHTPIFMVFPQ